MNKKILVLLPAAMLVLAGCGGNGSTTGSTTTTSSSTSSSTTEPVPEKSSLQKAYEAAAALAKGGETSEAYTFSGVITSVCGNTFFVQDENQYAMLVYGGKTSYENVAVGKTVTVTATLKNYNGCLETSTISSVTVGEDGLLPAAVVVSSRAGLANVRQNVLVDCTLKMPETLATWSSSSEALVNTTIGEDTETTTVKFDKYGYNDEQGAIYNKVANRTVKLSHIIASAYDKTAGEITSNQFTFTGTSKIEYTAPEITEIKFKTHATKTEYAVGDHYDPTGLELTVKYNDGVEVDVAYADSAADFTFTPSLDTALTSDITAVKISLKEFKGDPLSQDIKVIDKVVQSIEVKQTPTIIDYYVGEHFDPTGLIITATYDKGEPADVAYKGNEGMFDFDPSLTTELETTHTQVVITYGNKTTTQSITVSEVSESKTVTLKKALGSAIASVGGTESGTLNFDDETEQDITWTRTLEYLATDKKDYVAYANSYVQCGSSNALETINFTTNSGFESVSKIVVDCASKSGKGLVEVKVGGIALGETKNSPEWKDNKGGTIEFTGSGSGVVSVTLKASGTTSGLAQYIKSISIFA